MSRFPIQAPAPFALPGSLSPAPPERRAHRSMSRTALHQHRKPHLLKQIHGVVAGHAVRTKPYPHGRIAIGRGMCNRRGIACRRTAVRAADPGGRLHCRVWHSISAVAQAMSRSRTIFPIGSRRSVRHVPVESSAQEFRRHQDRRPCCLRRVSDDLSAGIHLGDRSDSRSEQLRFCTRLRGMDTDRKICRQAYSASARTTLAFTV